MAEKKTILIVDDDPTNLRVGKNALSPYYKVFAVDSGKSMFNLLKNVRPDLILLDVDMQEMNGHEAIVLLQAEKSTSEIPVIFLTGKTDEEMELKGLSLGAVDYITKPFSPLRLLKRLEMHLLVAKQKNELQDFNDNLTQMVEEKTKAVVSLKNAIISTMAELVENRDKITGNHISNTQMYLGALMDALISENVYAEQLFAMDKQLIISSSQLHDVGKIAISDTILNKPGELSQEEIEIMQRHTTVGEKVILRLKEKTSDSENDFLEYARIIAISHHEKWDGSGYPHGLKGEEIPLLGRIMAIADVYDALTQERPYKAAMSHKEAVKIMVESSGTHFDPALVKVFLKSNHIFEKNADRKNNKICR